MTPKDAYARWRHLADEERRLLEMCALCKAERCVECDRCDCGGKPTSPDLSEIEAERDALIRTAPTVETYTFLCVCGAGYDQILDRHCFMCGEEATDVKIFHKLPWDLPQHQRRRVESGGI